jgi:hypothetical protein
MWDAGAPGIYGIRNAVGSAVGFVGAASHIQRNARKKSIKLSGKAREHRGNGGPH